MNALRLLSQEADNLLAKNTSARRTTMWIVLMLLFVGQVSLSAQSITCRGNVEIGFGPWCKINLSASQFMSNPSGVYTFEIVGTDVSGTLPFEVQTADVDLNLAYDYKITNAGGVTCDHGKLTFRDYSPPTCGTFDPIIATYCTEGDVTAAFTGPAYTDCSDEIIMNFTDLVEESCDFATDGFYQGKKVIKKITRSWTATDAFGNQTTLDCKQTLYILSPALEDIEVESTVMIACDKNISIVDAIHPDSLPISAVPHIVVDGELQAVNALCKYALVKFDSDPVPHAGNKVKIFRNWQITNWCTSESKTVQQTILFIDETAPELTVPDEVVLEANIFSDNEFKLCSSIGQLPLATATDNCSEDEDINISIFIPLHSVTIGNGAVLTKGLPLGDNDVIYTATDACGVKTSKTVNVKVVDTTKPVALCTPEKNIGITNGSVTSVAATEFENGSTDNCCIDRFEVRRADALNGDLAFNSHVEFTCDDDVVQVIFRAYDCAGNFNDCTLEVTVQDLIIPTITAPDATADLCTEVVGVDLSDLTILQDRYGVPMIVDNCDDAYFIENTPIVTEQDCEGKDILRSFYGVDAYGNLSVDTVYQLVTINGVSKFDVTFPESIEIECSMDIPVTNPIVLNKGCGELFTRYQDVIYNQDEGACYKLIRTWEVLDWCAFEVGQASDGSQVILDATNQGLPHEITDGYVKYIQEIRVVDSEAPVISSAPDDIEVSLVDNCEGYTIIPSPVVSDNNCNGNTQVIATVNGLQVILGNKLFGTVGETHVIRYQAVDGCQNRSDIVETTVTFVDKKKPTPICLSLSTELGSGGEVVIWANDFESGSSYDNCELSDVALINKIVDVDGDNDFLDDVLNTPPTGQTSLTFTCADQGNQFVQYWIQDISGNWEFCVTGIFITDADDDDCNGGNGGNGSQNATVSGLIQTSEGKNIEQVEVKIDNPNMPALFTGFDGFFNFIGLGTNQEYTITPKKDVADDNGISTYDMVLLQRHILGITELDSPYKIMAADVNSSGGVSTADIVEMRKLILGINDKLTKTDSWKFVPADHVFTDPKHPFSTDVPESITAMSNTEVAFTGYKMGDLNLNANTANLLGDGVEGELQLWLSNTSFVAGEQIEVDIHVGEAVELLGLGLEINYDNSLLSFEGMSSETLNGLEPTMYYDNPRKEGSVQLAWYDAYASFLDLDDAVITLRFIALQDADIENGLQINSSQLSTAVVNKGAELIEKEITTNIKEITSEIKLYQNQPNPFSSETMIRFDLLEADYVNLDVIDISGKLIYNLKGDFPRGENQVIIQAHDLPDSGIYYFRLRSGDFIETKKLIHIK